MLSLLAPTSSGFRIGSKYKVCLQIHSFLSALLPTSRLRISLHRKHLTTEHWMGKWQDRLGLHFFPFLIVSLGLHFYTMTSQPSLNLRYPKRPHEMNGSFVFCRMHFRLTNI